MMKSVKFLLLSITHFVFPASCLANWTFLPPAGEDYVEFATDGPTGHIVGASMPNPNGGLTAAGTNALQTDFPDWSFTDVQNTPLSGTMTVNYAKAEALQNMASESFKVTYTPGNGDPPLANLYWLQIVTKIGFAQGNGTFVDPKDANEMPSAPFYWDIQGNQPDLLDSTYKANGSYMFIDGPLQFYAAAPPAGAPDNFENWYANLFNGPTNG